MTKIGKVWTGGVAYVSLLVGAGLSVAGNLADTYRTRGADVDTLDKVMAAGWPLLVLLAIEMFVSPRWSEARLFQAWRWIGCLSVGGMAMVVSWTHLHDLMASRGQLLAVSILGPLAIDGMAIMATGLILSTRVRGQVATATATLFDHADMGGVVTATRTVSDTWPRTSATPAGWTGPKASAADVAMSAAAFRSDMATDMDNRPDTDMDIVATRPQGDYDAWERGYEDALRVTGQEVAMEAEQWLSAMSVATAPLPRRTSGGVPAEFVDMATAWEPSALSRPDMVKLSASHFGVSTRTVRRWLSAVTGQPVSGA